MDIILMLVVGLIAGALATMFMGQPSDWITDLLFGILGSFVGSWVFGLFSVAATANGTFEAFVLRVIVATVGAVILIGIWRLIHRQSLRG